MYPTPGMQRNNASAVAAQAPHGNLISVSPISLDRNHGSGYLPGPLISQPYNQLCHTFRIQPCGEICISAWLCDWPAYPLCLAESHSR